MTRLARRLEACTPHVGKPREKRAILVVVVVVVESVRLIEADEWGVIQRWRDFIREVREEVLPPKRGRLVKSLGTACCWRSPARCGPTRWTDA
jgi:hypothetical protein